MRLEPFRMERWQSTWEHRVRWNLSESGVHPMSVGELLALAEEARRSGEAGARGRADGAGAGAALSLDDLADVRLGYGQSDGSGPLKERIAALYEGAGPENVLVTTGGAEANFVAFWHLARADAPAAVLLPNYMQVPGLLDSFGVRSLPFRLDPATGRVDLDGLERALEAGAGFVLVTHPNNPTGYALHADDRRGIAERAEAHGAWILSDEVYRGAEVDGEESATFWGSSGRVITTHSLSKAYGLPGLRLGWAVGPAEVVADLWARTDYTTIAPASLSDALATLALTPGVRERVLERTRGILRENLGALRAWLDERSDLFSYRAPDAGAICWVGYDAERVGMDSLELAERLRVEQDVLIVPGAHFGIEHHLRIGYGIPKAELMEALERVEAVMRG